MLDSFHEDVDGGKVVVIFCANDESLVSDFRKVGVPMYTSAWLIKQLL